METGVTVPEKIQTFKLEKICFRKDYKISKSNTQSFESLVSKFFKLNGDMCCFKQAGRLLVLLKNPLGMDFKVDIDIFTKW